MSFEDLLVHEVYIQTKTTTSNAWGEKIASWTTPSTTTKCRMSPITDELRLLSQGEYRNVDYKAYFMPTVSITYDDRILWEGVAYRIRSIKKDSLGHHLEVLLEREV